MTTFIIGVLVTAIALLIISKLPLGIEIENPVIALVSGAVIGVFTYIWQIFPGALKVLGTVVTLGLLPFLMPVIIFGLSAWLVKGFRLQNKLLSPIVGAVALWLVSQGLRLVLGIFGVDVPEI